MVKLASVVTELCAEEETVSLLNLTRPAKPEGVAAPAEAPSDDYEDYDSMLAPQGGGPLVAPLQEEPAMAPAEMVGVAPMDADAPDAGTPALPTAPPATPVPPGGFITDFTVDGAPDAPTRPTPPTPPARDMPGPPADAPEPTDSLPDPMAPEAAFAFNLVGDDTSGSPKAGLITSFVGALAVTIFLVV